MIVAVDSSILLHLIDPALPVPVGSDGVVPDRCRERLDYLIDQMSKNNERLIVPTPVLSEVLVKAGHAGQDWLTVFRGRRAIRIAPFDERAAVECAALAQQRAASLKKGPKAKAKFDEQIVSIAIVERAQMILSDDSDIKSLAPKSLTVKGIRDLALPPASAQSDMFPDPSL